MLLFIREVIVAVDETGECECVGIFSYNVWINKVK